MKTENKIKGSPAKIYMTELLGVTTYRCGCRVYNQSHDDAIVDKVCYDCLLLLIGTRQTVVRYGNIPKGGKSYNYRDNKYESGVSCYLLNDKPRPEFSDRPKLVVSAIVIDTGSDDEPIIDSKTIAY